MDTRDYVEHLLKNYHEIKRSLDRLQFEIERFSGLSYDKVIETLNYATPEGERVQSNSVSDKSARIALMYREQTDKLNGEMIALVRKYQNERSELDVLEYCITLLEPRQSQVITDMFIHRMTWDNM